MRGIIKLNKIAVFLSGPYRYVDKVIENFDKLAKIKNLNYSYFIHLWKSDLSNDDKKRLSVIENYEILRKNQQVSSLTIQNPYTKDYFENNFGNKNNTHSSINAPLGMLIGVNVLCNQLKSTPDYDDYKYILRLRTDIILLNLDWIEETLNNIKIQSLSLNPYLPNYIISDHIFFVSKKYFYSFWHFDNFKKMYKTFKKGNYNPESMLTLLNRKNFFKNLFKNNHQKKNIKRFIDYIILYNPTRETDPKYLRDLINGNGVEYMYNNFDKIYSENLKIHFDENILKNKFSKFIQFLILFFGEKFVLKCKRILDILFKKN